MSTATTLRTRCLAGRRVAPIARYFGILLAVLLAAAWGQTPSQIQYTYDAAGNVIQVTRSAVTPKPDLTISNLSVGTVTGNANGSYNIPATFQVNNTGNATAMAAWYDRGYLSANTVLHDTDQVLGGYNTRSANLDAGANYAVSATFMTSATTPPGNYYLIVKADGGTAASGQYSPRGPNYVVELDETNNSQAIAIGLPANPKPDLTVTNASVGAIAVSQSGSYAVPVGFTVTNIGVGPATGNWYDTAYLSTDATLDNNDVNFGFVNHSGGLAAGATYNVSSTLTTATTIAPGSYTLILKADGHGSIVGGTNTDGGVVVETNETNNTQALSISLPTRPDLTLSNASVGAITVNQSGAYAAPVSFRVTNIGASAAAGNWYDTAYLSADATLDNSDVNFGFINHSGGLAAGATYNVSSTFTTAATTAPGSYTLILKADGHGSIVGGTNTDGGVVVETNETNNTQALSISLPGKPDLTASNMSVGTIVKNANHSYTIPVTYTVTNIGASPAQPTWYDLAYLSADGLLDNGDQNLSGYGYRNTLLAAGASYTVTTSFTTTTTTAAGSYTLFIKADGHGQTVTGGTNTDNGAVAEANETNNLASTTVVLP